MSAPVVLYAGYAPTSSGFALDVVDLSSISPKAFFQTYVKTSRPCVIQGSAGVHDAAQWTLEELEAAAGPALVHIERRDEGTRTFGTGRKAPTTFSSFVASLRGGAPDLYLTTQPLDIEEEEEEGKGKEGAAKAKKKEKTAAAAAPQGRKGGGRRTEGAGAGPSSSASSKDAAAAAGAAAAPWRLMGEPLLHLADRFPLRPPLLASLPPSSINFWMGSSPDGSSSNLHHDFHANLYTLLRGTKTFTLSPPSSAGKLYTHGRPTLVHPNGLINYAGTPTRSDGVPLSLDEEGEEGEEDGGALAAALGDVDVDEKEDAAEDMWAALLKGGAGSSAKKKAAGGQKRPRSAEAAAEGEKKGKGSAAGKASASRATSSSAPASAPASGPPDHFSRIPLPALREEARALITTKKRGAPTAAAAAAASAPPAKGKRAASSTSTSTAGAPSSSAAAPPSADDLALLAAVQSLPRVRKEFPLFATAPLTTVTITAGQSLWLPAGWFHEVVSKGADGGGGGGGSGAPAQAIHYALNHWVAPPAPGGTFASPYEDDHWERAFEAACRLQGLKGR
jgi:hypothetical protein